MNSKMQISIFFLMLFCVVVPPVSAQEDRPTAIPLREMVTRPVFAQGDHVPSYPTPIPLSEMLTRRPTSEPQRVVATITSEPTPEPTAEPTREPTAQPLIPTVTSVPIEQVDDGTNAIAIIRSLCLSVLFLGVVGWMVIYLWRRNQ